MPYPFIRTWKRHSFKVLVVVSILVLVLCWYWNDTDQGTYSMACEFNLDDLMLMRTSPPKFVQESKGEKECRRVLESMFGRPFYKQRPAFLYNNVTGRTLELDCCNDELALAVEYNGKQHYEYVPSMHKNQEAFRTQQYRDEMKQRLCKDHNYTLIIVPYTIPVPSIENYLREELRRYNYL